MPQSERPSAHPIRRVSTLLAVLMLLATALGIAILTGDISRQIDRQSAASTDNLQWTLSQLDVEILTLERTLNEAISTPSRLAEVRKRFDVFYSRIKTLDEGSAFASLHHNPEFVLRFDRLKRFVHQTAPLMDGPDAALLTQIPLLAAYARGLMDDSHRISLIGVDIYARISDSERQAVKATLVDLAVMGLVLVGILVAMLLWVLRLSWITQMKANETADTLSRLDAVVTSALDAVITLNDLGLIVEVNPAAEQTFGFDREEAIGHSLSLFIPRRADGSSQLPPRDLALPPHQRRMRVTARHSDGHDFPAEVSLSSAQAGRGLVHVVFLRDLSQQVAAEEELVAARDKAQAGEKAKTDLLVLMSHEIRTPLNGMIGTVDLLENTDLTAHQRDYLRVMKASGRLLMQHVNDVLDIARLDSGKAGLTLAPLRLSHLVREVIENQTPASLERGNVLRFAGPPVGQDVVLSDETLLRQVLMNLVGNAVKFTRDGRIKVTIRHLSPEGPTEIAVGDTGAGIQPGDLGRIFEDFVTLDPSYARRSSGTGLGLGIVRRIVSRMGGQIGVESTPGQGSCFRVTLPLTLLGEDAMPLVQSLADPVARRLSVLVVEDNDFNRLIVRDMLRADGHQVTEALDGAEGICLAAEQRFDAVLMDISMPGIDGLAATGRIREGQGASAASPILALTAHAGREEIARFRAAGIQDVLIKPLTRVRLRAALAGLPTAQVPGAEAATAALIDPVILDDLQQTLGPDKARHLLQRFLTDSQARLALLGARIPQAEDDAALVADIHRMNGTAAMFGACALQAGLSAIEAGFKAGNPLAVRLGLPELMRIWQKTQSAYRDLPCLAGSPAAVSPAATPPDGAPAVSGPPGLRPQSSNLR